MEENFIKSFLSTSEQVYNTGINSHWDIPKDASKEAGDFGLLPEDTDIGAWQIPPSSAMLLRFLVLLTKSKTILELGASVGYSTIWLALGAKETGGHVYTTEIFPPKIELARKHFIESGVNDLVTLLEQDILQVLERWESGRPIDMVFMDADKQRYDRYLDLLLPKIKDGGLIVVDNVGNYPAHMKPFLQKCKALQGSAVHFLNIDNGLLLISKNSGFNILPYINKPFPIDV